jgi:hypothetical protein
MTKNQKTKKYNVVSPQEIYKNDLKSLYNKNLKTDFFLKNSFFFNFKNSSKTDVNLINYKNHFILSDVSASENYFFRNKSKRKF